MLFPPAEKNPELDWIGVFELVSDKNNEVQTSYLLININL